MKQEIIEILSAQISTELRALIQAQETAVMAATHEESRPENQYDTRSTEASYLAKGQADRIESLRGSLQVLKSFSIKHFEKKDAIAIGALVALDLEGEALTYFLLPTAGGYKVEIKGKLIQCVTPEAALGKALLGKRAGEQIELRTRQLRIYDILSVE
jgi:transcription elongation GreA/GreB family factor